VDDENYAMVKSAFNYRLSPSASFRDLGEEGIILMANTGQLYSTNQTGSVFIQNLQNGSKWDHAIETIILQYDGERHTVESDLKDLITYLVSEAVLVPADD
jgi:hypothetical protein